MMIYFIHNPELQMVKIGHSKDPRKRLRELQVASPGKLVLLGVLLDEDFQEKALHRKFQNERLRGEWFTASARLLDFISKMAVPLVPGSLQAELLRRQNCRYGLPGVKVSIAGREAWIEETWWDRYGKLKLSVCWDGPPKPPQQIKVFTSQELFLSTFPEPSEVFSASDCNLISDWPVVCGCWLEDEA